MMPAKIITLEEAKGLGLSKSGGSRTVAAGSVALKKDGKLVIIERTAIKEDGKFEILFMADERKEQLRQQGELEKYLAQFSNMGENK